MHMSSFYLRRVLRIWPLYATFLSLVALLAAIAPSIDVSKWQLLSFLLLAGNWYAASFGYGQPFISHLWSISLEEQFYLIWPRIVKAGKRYTWSVALATLPIGLGVIYVSASRGVNLQPALWTNSFVQFPLFAIGAILALVLRRRRLTLPRFARLFTFLSGFALWLLATCSCQFGQRHYVRASMLTTGYILAILGTVLIFLSVFDVSPRLAPRPLIYLGKISYGLYVFHAPCIAVMEHMFRHKQNSWEATLVLGLSASLVCAALSYRLLESPFLRLKERFTLVASRAV